MFYNYKAKLVRIIDADSIVLRLDLGFRLEIEDTFRLAGINCPEINTDAGKAAKAFLEEQLKDKDLRIVCHKHGKYRWLCDLYAGDFSESINETLIKAGHAAPYVK